MKSIYTTTGMLVILLTQFSWAELDHGISVGVLQQTQLFDLNNTTLNLLTNTPKIQYQLSSGPWLITASASKDEENRSRLSNLYPLRYKLDFKQSSESLYIDYNFDQLWASAGYSQSHFKQSFISSESDNYSEGENQSDYRSFIIDIGYGWHFENSQFSTSVGFSQQASNESYQLNQVIDSNRQNNQSTLDQIKQSGLLGSLSISYQHYFSMNQHLDWMLGSGINYSESIDGEAHTSQTSHTRLTESRFFASEDESFIDSDSKSTSLMVQSSLIMDHGSINLSADKLTSEIWSDALIEFGISLYF